MNNSDSFFCFIADTFRGDSLSIENRLSVYVNLLKSGLTNKSEDLLGIDLGSGRGEWLNLLANNNIACIGIDNNIALNQIISNNKIKKGDLLIELSKYPDNSFDFITAFHVVEHMSIDKILKLFNLAYQKLKNNGIFIIETPNIENLMVSTKSFYYDPSHVTKLPNQLLITIFNYFKFDNIQFFRLNQNNNISELTISLKDIICEVSPDYSVIGFKDGISKKIDSNEFNNIIKNNSGYSLEYLILLYEKNNENLKNQISNLRLELINSFNKIIDLEIKINKLNFLIRLSEKLKKLLKYIQR